MPYGECPEALFAMGAEHQAYLAEAVLAASTEQLPLLPVPHDVAPNLSDHYAFGEAGVPFLFLTCGRWVASEAALEGKRPTRPPGMPAASDLDLIWRSHEPALPGASSSLPHPPPQRSRLRGPR